MISAIGPRGQLRGPVEFYIMTPHTVPDIIVKAKAGDPSAQAAMVGLAGFLRAQTKTKRGDGPMCLMCDHEFHRRAAVPAAFVAMMPMFPSPGNEADTGLLCPVCDACFVRHYPRLDDAVCARISELWGGLDVRKVTAQ